MYTDKNVQNVLDNVNYYIELLESRKANCKWYRQTLRIDEVYDDLSIFDWWKNDLSISNLKDMKKFLTEAINLGFTGYVCFKVGVTGCANGMWAHKEESTNGYSPKGNFLYKSFTPAYNYWSIQLGDKMIPSKEEYNKATTIKKLKAMVMTTIMETC